MKHPIIAIIVPKKVALTRLEVKSSMVRNSNVLSKYNCESKPRRVVPTKRPPIIPLVFPTETNIGREIAEATTLGKTKYFTGKNAY